MTPLDRNEHSGRAASTTRAWLNGPATVAALLMDPDGRLITGSDFLMDGGVTAVFWFGELAPQ